MNVMSKGFVKADRTVNNSCKNLVSNCLTLLHQLLNRVVGFVSWKNISTRLSNNTLQKVTLTEALRNSALTYFVFVL